MNERETIYTPEKGWHREGDLLELEWLERASRLVQKGATVWLKCTCQNCHARIVSEEENTLYETGYECCNCGEITKPRAFGFMVMFKRREG